MRISYCVLTIIFVAFVATSAWAADEGSWQGWIADENCAKNYSKVASASHAGCAKACVGKGASWVLATQEGPFLLDLGEVTAEDHLGAEIVIKGELDDDTIKVTSISMANE